MNIRFENSVISNQSQNTKMKMWEEAKFSFCCCEKYYCWCCVENKWWEIECIFCKR
jgi:hypothetical protein